MFTRAAFAIPLALSLGVTACGDDDKPGTTPTPTPVTSTIVSVAVADGRFTTLVAALQRTGLDSALVGDGPFTVFAPTDAAFTELLTVLGISADDLLANPALADILSYHVISGAAIDAATVIGSAPNVAGSLEGSDIQYSVRDGKVYLDGGTSVTQPDVMADNGIIHVVDSVLFAPGDFPGTIVQRLQIAPGFSSLVGAAVAATLPDGTTSVAAALSGPGPITLFAPHNEAFAALSAAPSGDELTDTLLYHAVSGDRNAGDVLGATTLPSLLNSGAPVAIDSTNVRFGGANISTVDIDGSNGRIHVIDSVVAAPADIATVATNAGFNNLVAALGAAGLTSVFQDDIGGQDGNLYTVFAPTDDAFNAMLDAFGASGDLIGGAGALDAAGWPLAQILSQHVLAGVVDSAAATMAAGGSVNTIVSSADHSGSLDISAIDGGLVLMGHARITGTDVVTRNGIIHVIDSVIFPRETNLGQDYPGTIAQLALASPMFSTLVVAVTDADAAPGILTALADPGQTLTLFAPTDGAFAKVPGAALTGLLGDGAALSNTLLYHAVGAKVLGAAVVTGEVSTLVGALGDPSSFDDTLDAFVDMGITLETTATGDAATVVYGDLETANGVIHVIDEVLLPASL
jgi:uncharacterized surface protein with fasciclin (FAS1) repeats